MTWKVDTYMHSLGILQWPCSMLQPDAQRAANRKLKSIRKTFNWQTTQLQTETTEQYGWNSTFSQTFFQLQIFTIKLYTASNFI